MTFADEVKRERDGEGVSIFEAFHRVMQRQMIRDVDAAETVDDLKHILRELILETRFDRRVAG